MATPNQAAGFFDGLTAVYLIDLVTKPLVFATLVFLLASTLLRRQSAEAVKGLARTFSEIKVGDVSLKFQQLEERVAIAESKAEDLQQSLDELAVGRDELDSPLTAFNSKAKAEDLDDLASRLRPIAATLSDPTPYEADLAPTASETKVFGAAIVARAQPKARFAEPLIGQIDTLAGDADLRGFRLKVVYRLVMALETVLRTDNRLSRHKLTPEVRARAAAALRKLAAHPRCLADDARAGAKGIGARIGRTLALVQQP
jgi:hypothetical protein